MFLWAFLSSFEYYTIGLSFCAATIETSSTKADFVPGPMGSTISWKMEPDGSKLAQLLLLNVSITSSMACKRGIIISTNINSDT